MTPFDHRPLVEAAEAAEMQEAIRMQADVSEDGVPRGWIGPVEGLRRQRVIRQLRAHTDAQAARIKELEGAADNLLIAIGMGWDLDGVVAQMRTALEPRK